MVKITIPAGRYYVGDVAGLTKPLVAIPARSSVFYDDEGGFEVEIAGGGSCMPDEDAFGIFGLIEFENTGLTDDDFDFGGFEVNQSTEVLFDFDYLEIVGVMKFSVAREAGLKFTSTEEEFELAMGE
jgi:hypothetical protein